MTSSPNLKPTANADGGYYGPQTDAVIERHLGQYGLEELRRLATARGDRARVDLYWQLTSLLDQAASADAAAATTLQRRTSAARIDFAAAEVEIAARSGVENLIGAYRDLPVLAARQEDAARHLDAVAKAVAACHRAMQQISG